MPAKNRIDLRRVNRSARNQARARVLATDGPCPICGRPIDRTVRWPDPWAAEVDEIIPVSRGGSPTDLRNLQRVHRRCNQLKSDRSMTWAVQAARGGNVKIPASHIPFRKSEW